MSRSIATLLAVLALIAAVFSFMGDEIITGVAALVSFGLFLILIDILKHLERHTASQKALAKTLSSVEFSRAILLREELYSAADYKWAEEVLEQAQRKPVID
jgi:hypothetical protein